MTDSTLLSDGLYLEVGPNEAVHRWKRMAECDEFVGARRSKHTVVACNNSIYIFGGDNGKSMLNDVLHFDVKEISWGRAVTGGSIPAPRYHHSAVVHNLSMYIFGGYTGDIHSNSNLTNKNDLYEFRFNQAQWVEWPKLGDKIPVPRSAHGSAVFEDKLYIFAGYDGNARLNDMWMFPLEGKTRYWTQVEQKGECPPTCCNFPVAVARDCMFVFSGQSGAKITNSLFQFNFKNNTWTRISTDHILRNTPPPPARRYGHSMVAYDRHLYVFGGAADSSLSNDLHCFDLDSQTWSVILPAAESCLPSGRLFHAAAVIDNAMYIFGGTIDNNVRSGEMYRFQFSNYPKCTLVDDFGRLLDSKMFCDIQFIIGTEQKVIQAHLAFVAARSSYLRNEIRLTIENRRRKLEKQCDDILDVPNKDLPMLEIRLSDANPEAFEMILSYIYMDSIDVTKIAKDGESPFCNRILLQIMNVYKLAVQFNMIRLEQLCIQYLNNTININNVLDALHNADALQLIYIKEFCLKFVVKENNFNHIVMSADFEKVDRRLMVEIIRRKQKPQTKVNSEIAFDNVGNSLHEDMRNFLKYNGNEFFDIDLVVDNHPIQAHKTLLVARCEYFQAMFRSFMPANNKVTIQIGDMIPSKESFQSLLRYIYYGEILMPPEDSLYLFSAPHFYGFTNNRLQAFCKQNLEINVTFENAIQILEAADKMQAVEIKKYALDVIVKNFIKVADLPRLKLLSKQLIIEILASLANSMRDGTFKPDMNSVSINTDS